ncbi:MAG TPA: hypothetical protein IAA29_17005, partial [Candidatus Paenibacillus intestinavium]|nr:hypothetical protein [Candidatus Paenibacillus intestinavium]
MTTKKIWLITLLFLTILVSFRLVWLQYNSTSNQPVAINGVLDLRDWDDFSNHPLPLNGEWEFSPETFHFQNGAVLADSDAPSQLIQVPGNWSLDSGTYSNDKYGFGTYRLKILVDPDKGKSYGIH